MNTSRCSPCLHAMDTGTTVIIYTHHMHSMCQGLQQALPTHYVCLSLTTLEVGTVLSPRLKGYRAGTRWRRNWDSHPGKLSPNQPLCLDWQPMLLGGPTGVPSRETRAATWGPHVSRLLAEWGIPDRTPCRSGVGPIESALAQRWIATSHEWGRKKPSQRFPQPMGEHLGRHPLYSQVLRSKRVWEKPPLGTYHQQVHCAALILTTTPKIEHFSLHLWY